MIEDLDFIKKRFSDGTIVVVATVGCFYKIVQNTPLPTTLSGVIHKDMTEQEFYDFIAQAVKLEKFPTNKNIDAHILLLDSLQPEIKANTKIVLWRKRNGQVG